MRPPTHILVVNGIKVRRPVFVLGAPHSGADLLARAIKRSAGFHLTIGRPSVVRTVYAFARRPSIVAGPGAARVIRDAFAEAWQVTSDGCGSCMTACREAGGVVGQSPCVSTNGLSRFADATPDLLYSGPTLLEAFPDARMIQILRDGRDVAADMLEDPACLAWFKPSMLSAETEYPSPFFGVSRSSHRDKWVKLPAAGKCALRWRSAVRLSAALRRDLPAEQLTTVRYEDLVAHPAKVTESLSPFLDGRVSTVALHGPKASPPGSFRARLSADAVQLVEKIAHDELTRLGYLA